MAPVEGAYSTSGNDNYAIYLQLVNFAAEVKKSGFAGGANLFLQFSGDGCFDRALLIAIALEDSGINVSYYAFTVQPKTYDRKKTFNFHIAVAVSIDGVIYVVDPYYSGKGTPGLTKYEEWVTQQDPKDYYLLVAVDNNGKVIPNKQVKAFYDKYNTNPNMTLEEYAENQLLYYSKTGRLDYDGGEIK